MDTLERYRQIIEAVLRPYAERRYSGADITNEPIFDRAGNHYLITSVGWQGYRRVAHNLLHLDIIGGKIWIQKDGTEDGIAAELEAAGVPKHDIVLAFRHAEDRALIPEYATA
ncbi:MAG: XisI protein [Armatimonadetes bacterium]|nr:XisI protein [Armatimonadota bacterium]